VLLFVQYLADVYMITLTWKGISGAAWTRDEGIILDSPLVTS
jgi:hypothetical protein